MEKNKKIKIASIAAAVVAVIVAAVAVISSFNLEIQYSILYSMMPDYVERTVNDDIPIKIYKRKNPDYEYSKETFEENPMNKYEFYYYDDGGNEVVINGGDKLIYEGKDNGAVFVSFIPGAMEKLAGVKKAVQIVSAIIITALIVGLIVLWFFRWSKKQDKEKQDKFKAKNNAKRSKNNK